MGQDFRAMIGHSLTVEKLCTLPAALDRLTPALSTDLDVIGVGSAIRWHWTGALAAEGHFEQWFEESIRDEGVAELRAVEALWIDVTRHILQVGSWVRWRTFTSQPAVQQSVRRLCAQVAGIVGASVIYYLPDTGSREAGAAGAVLFDGGSIEQVGESLQHYGPSRASITDAELGGYYLEGLPLELQTGVRQS